MKTYVGITIGPITNALQYAKDPQSLWFACAIFSEISREICEALTAPNCSFEDVEIYTPYYFHGMKVDDGVAKTHDRIVFSAENVEEAVLDKIISLVKGDVSELFPVEYQSPAYKKFLDDYFQIHYICLEENENLNKNCMMEIYPHLHDMECRQVLSEETAQNPFYDLFGLREDVRSLRIMSSPLAHTVKKGAGQFFNGRGEFKTVYEIANPREPDGRKKVPYYCLVRCNGDDIDHLLRSFSENKKLISFSVACLQHSITACEMIRQFGGLTVYAGGDEFFFFAPLIGCDGKTVFELCQRIEQKFYSFMKEHLPWSNSPSLSFGVSIQRCTHEVYEAFTKTGELLKLAKTLSLKNNTAVRITNKSRMENIIVNNDDETDMYSQFADENKLPKNAGTYTVKVDPDHSNLVIANFETPTEEANTLVAGTLTIASKVLTFTTAPVKVNAGATKANGIIIKYNGLVVIIVLTIPFGTSITRAIINSTIYKLNILDNTISFFLIGSDVNIS